MRASMSRQIWWERRTSGVYCSPSPIATRVMRVSPCEEPSACGGEYWSMPSTLAPRLAAW